MDRVIALEDLELDNTTPHFFRKGNNIYACETGVRQYFYLPKDVRTIDIRLYNHFRPGAVVCSGICLVGSMGTNPMAKFNGNKPRDITRDFYRQLVDVRNAAGKVWIEVYY